MIETTDQETKIIATVDGKPRTISKSSLRRHLKLNDEAWISSLLDAEIFVNLSLMGYNILPNQSNIATVVVCLATNRVYNFSKMIFDGMVRNINNEPASLLIDDRQGEAFPTVSSLDAGHDRENITKTSTMPHESSPRVPSLDADEGNQDLEISRLNARVKFLKDKDKRHKKPIQEDVPITGVIIDIREELGADKSNDTKEMINVLSSMEAANILSSGGATASVSPANVLPTAGVPTISGSFPTVSAIFTTASVVTPYTRWSRGITIGSLQPMRIPIVRAKDKGKEKVIETEVPKKRKLQEQIDAQVAREMEEEFARENQRLSKQLVRDSEIVRIHAKKELNTMIEGLDRSNEVIAKHLSEYEQAEVDLYVGEKIELIRMTLEQLKEKFIPVWKQWEDFVPMSSKEESKRVKRQVLKIDKESSKRVKISKGVSKEELKGMMQLVPLEEVYIKALQQFDREDLHQLWTLVKETFSIKQATRNKENELWIELKRMFEPDFEDHLWIHHPAFMHDPLDWKLYDTCVQDEELFEASSPELLWERIHYSLLHSTSLIPYPRFTKIIIGHYMTNFLKISRRAQDKYHNLKDDDLMKNIFNSRRYKDKVGMKILDWMISEEMKQTEHYRIYMDVFGIDVPLIQSPPTESTQGTHRTPSAPRQEEEARENVALVEKHLTSEEIEKMVEGQEHVVDDSSIPMNDEHNILGTRLELRSDMESLKGRYRYLFEHLKAKFMPMKSFVTLADHLHKSMADSLPTMVNNHIKEQVEKTLAIHPRDQDDPHDDAHPKGENSVKRQKTSKYEAYVSGESSSGQDNKQEQDDDEIPTKQVSQDIKEERDPEAPALSLINQDLLYLKKGNSGPEKIVLSLYKFLAVVFNDDDIKERTSRWVNNCVKKFNPYARYGVEH
uniref:Synaptobrevin, longin-like domain protein n=1 Tax=Tanacetum cinerariifolium TaxID=118510 RepID=A0A6L2LPX7_TANCI|nr:hypothetical protein [Tanacetum cinerariifolium]